MKTTAGLAAATVVLTAAEYAVPGKPAFHYGWYGALLLGFAVWAWLTVPKSAPKRAALLLAAGTSVVALSGAASGLLGPDTQTVVGAPGASVANADLGGSFQFPFTASENTAVELHRGAGTRLVGSRRTYVANAALWQEPRTVVYVEVRDARGNHLTVTQPTNSSFLSPVLLMQGRTTVAGMNVAVDSFAVPAVRRNVKAVLFTPQQAAQLRTARPAGGNAVLFAVSDFADRVLPRGIGIAASGETVALGGLRLRAAVSTFPAIVVASVPFVPAFLFGLLLCALAFTPFARLERGAAGEREAANLG